MYHYTSHSLELPVDDLAPDNRVQSTGVAVVDDDIMASKPKSPNALSIPSASNESALVIEPFPSLFPIPSFWKPGTGIEWKCVAGLGESTE